jgi:hypothetical protein
MEMAVTGGYRLIGNDMQVKIQWGNWSGNKVVYGTQYDITGFAQSVKISEKSPTINVGGLTENRIRAGNLSYTLSLSNVVLSTWSGVS